MYNILKSLARNKTKEIGTRLKQGRGLLALPSEPSSRKNPHSAARMCGNNVPENSRNRAPTAFSVLSLLSTAAHGFHGWVFLADAARKMYVVFEVTHGSRSRADETGKIQVQMPVLHGNADLKPYGFLVMSEPAREHARTTCPVPSSALGARRPTLSDIYLFCRI